MKTQPTHDDVARQARAVWQDRGCPEGIDTEIWLEAERQLAGDTAGATGRKPGSFADQARQEKEARAPQAPTHTAPKTKPAETGKPVWDKPHSR